MYTLLSREVAFSKFQGAGNDFIIIHDPEKTFPSEDVFLIRRLCDRQLGVGADGLILVQSSSQADYKMQIFNKDGLEASMCGNGLRCVARYITLYLNPSKNSLQIESARGVHECVIEGKHVKTALGTPHIHGTHVLLSGGYYGYFLDTGVPHVVVFSEEEVEEFAFKSRRIRYQKEFAPQGVNVNFAQRMPSGEIILRTYERGVEDETLACGTGAAATAVAAYHLYGAKNPICIRCRSQELLVCELEVRNNKVIKIFLEGLAQHVFDGKVDLYLL